MEYANQLFELELQKIQNNNDKILLSSIWDNKHIFLSGESGKRLNIKQDIIYLNLVKRIGGTVAKLRRRWNYIRCCYRLAAEANKSYCYDGILRVIYNNTNEGSKMRGRARVVKKESPTSVDVKLTPGNETSFNTALGQVVWEHFTFVKDNFWSCNICQKEFNCSICGALVLLKHLDIQHVPNVST